MFQICSFRANPRRRAFYCSPLVYKRLRLFRKICFFMNALFKKNKIIASISHRFFIIFHDILGIYFRIFFVHRFFMKMVPKKSILEHPWRPAGSKMVPKVAQVVPKGHRFLNPVAPLFSDPLHRSSLGRPRTPPGSIWHAFGTIFGMKSEGIPHAISIVLWNKICRLPSLNTSLNT